MKKDKDKKKKLSLSKVASGFRKRTLVTAKLGARAGMAMLKSELNIGDKETDIEKAVQYAEQLVEEIDGLKGVVMKIGQMASYLGNSLPPEAQRVLSRLQAKGNSIDFELIEEIILDELGASHRDAFDSFEEEPCAAASIGQVHRAYHKNEKVAVKVQYPGIEKAIKSDLSLISNLLFMPLAASKVDRKGVQKEFRTMILQECDYVKERESQEIFGRLFKDTPEIVIPRVIRERSTRKVLTTEFLEGQDYYSMLDSVDKQTKNDYGLTMAAFVGYSLYRYGIFNADPHPGNYIFMDGKVGFLDFGSVKVFSKQSVDLWREMGTIVLNGDKKGLKEWTIKAGITDGRDKRFDWDFNWEFMSIQFKPYMSSDFEYNKEFMSEVNQYFINFKNRSSAKLPPEWLFLSRFQFGFSSILADLNVRNDWRTALEDVWSKPYEGVGEDVSTVGSLVELRDQYDIEN